MLRMENPLDVPAPDTQTQAPAWRWVDVLLVAAVSAAIMLGGTLALRQLKLEPLALSLGLSALEVVALIGSISWLGLWRRKFPWQVLGVRPAQPRWMWIAVVIGIVCLFLTGLVALTVQQLLGQPPTNPQLPFLLPKGLTPWSELLMFVLVGLLIPFAEELFFRGLLYTWLRQHFSFGVSALLSAVIFGAVHGDVSIAAGVAVMGLLQAWVFERSRSIWAPFIVHALNNGIKVILLYVMLAAGTNLTGF
jgi:membrane protease YdiL (CAAX protease family)